jgi:hypothetical protein
LEALKITPCSDSFIVAIVARETVLQWDNVHRVGISKYLGWTTDTTWCGRCKSHLTIL